MKSTLFSQVASQGCHRGADSESVSIISNQLLLMPMWLKEDCHGGPFVALLWRRQQNDSWDQAEIKPLPWLGGPRTQCLGDHQTSPNITRHDQKSPNLPNLCGVETLKLLKELVYQKSLGRTALKCQSFGRRTQWHGKVRQTRLAAPRQVFITQSQTGQEVNHVQ